MTLTMPTTTTPTLSPEAITLLRATKHAILEEPRHFDMSGWLQENNCNTTACIAGHIVCQAKGLTVDQAANDDTVAESSIGSLAQQLLGLESGAGVTFRLFYADCWPEPFQGRYENLLTDLGDLKPSLGGPWDVHVQAARIAADRIEHFIETDGAE